MVIQGVLKKKKEKKQNSQYNMENDTRTEKRKQTLKLLPKYWWIYPLKMQLGKQLIIQTWQRQKKKVKSVSAKKKKKGQDILDSRRLSPRGNQKKANIYY